MTQPITHSLVALAALIIAWTLIGTIMTAPLTSAQPVTAMFQLA